MQDSCSFLHVYSWDFLFVPVYSCLFLFIPVYSCQFLYFPVYSCLFLSISVYSCLFLSIPVYSRIFLSIHGRQIFFRGGGGGGQKHSFQGGRGVNSSITPFLMDNFFLFLSIPVYSCLFLPIPAYSCCVFLYIRVLSCVQLGTQLGKKYATNIKHVM
jgi:hypothetical protein